MRREMYRHQRPEGDDISSCVSRLTCLHTWANTNRRQGLQCHLEGIRVASDLAGDPVGVGGIQQEVGILVNSPVSARRRNVPTTGDASSVGSRDVDPGVVAHRAAVHDVLDSGGIGLPKQLVFVRHGAGFAWISSREGIRSEDFEYGCDVQVLKCLVKLMDRGQVLRGPLPLYIHNQGFGNRQFFRTNDTSLPAGVLTSFVWR